MTEVLEPKTKLNHGTYEIESLYEIGGQSSVYIGLHRLLEQRVIIKQTNIDDEFSDAIKEEGKILFSLSHPCLPRITNLFEDDGKLYLVMDYIDGVDLSALLKSKGTPFSYIDVIDWLKKLLEIVEYLQGCNPAIIHRDINPKNLRLNKTNRLFLLDFGIAKKVGQEHPLTGGTDCYESPEQLIDEEVDIRSDLYSISATAYYLLSGIKPPSARVRQLSIAETGLDPLQPLNTSNDAIPVKLSDILFKGMSLSRNDRSSDATAMKKLLADCEQSAYDSDLESETVTVTSASKSRISRIEVDFRRSRSSLSPNSVSLWEQGDWFNEIDKIPHNSPADRLLPFVVDLIDSAGVHKTEVMAKVRSVNAGFENDVMSQFVMEILDEVQRNTLSAEMTENLRDKIGRRLISSFVDRVPLKLTVTRSPRERAVVIARYFVLATLTIVFIVIVYASC